MGERHSGDIARVVVAPDRMSATIFIPAGLDAEVMKVGFLANLARERRVVVTQEVLARLGEIIERWRKDPGELSEVFVTGRRAVDGEPARLEWAEGFDPASQPKQEEEERADFYNAVEYVRATAGQVIARVTPATGGTDGQTVTGEVDKARMGRPYAWQIDPSSIEVDESEARARVCGVFMVRGTQVRISDLIEVTDVDFSTGNISVEGGVHVRSEVKDRFEIHATRDVVIDGLVESALIECGGNLHLRRGMAARERGRIDVKGNADVGYFNAVQGTVGGTLTFRRELMNCVLSIGGDFIGESGAVVGGRLVVGGCIRVGTLGSSAEVPTRIAIETTLPRAEERAELLRECKAVEAVAERLEAEKLLLEGLAGNLTSRQKERLAELGVLHAAAQRKLEANRAIVDEIDRCARTPAKIDLQVNKMIHPKVSLVIGKVEVTFSRAIQGPVRLGVGAGRKLVLKRADGSLEELRQFVSVSRAA